MRFAVLLLVAAAVPLSSAADTFTVRTPSENVSFDGSVYSEADGLITVLRPNGRLEFVPEGAIIKREPGDDPAPLTGDEMIADLRKRFGGPDGDLFMAVEQGSFVIGLVLQGKLDRKMTGRANKLLHKAAKFMNDVETTFTKFAKRMDLPRDPATHKLVMVIFETDAQFDQYTVETTNTGLSAADIEGFYAHQTNWLAVRLDECDDFALPLHEGIHQQVYNRGWFKRGSDVPKWFDEGIATGFEADGLDVDTDPVQVNARYAAKALEAGTVNFATIIKSDAAFGGDVLAGEAYVRAWALHWLLAGSRPSQYADFVRMLGTRSPGQDIDTDGRIDRFQEAFDVKVAGLEEEFAATLSRVAARQRVRPPEKKRPGQFSAQEDMGRVSLRMEGRGTRVRAGGLLTNEHPLRALTFKITITPPVGTKIVWVIPEVPPETRRPLPVRELQSADTSLSISIESALPDSPTARTWLRARY